LSLSMILTVSDVVRHWKLKELDRENAQRWFGGIVSKLAWKV